MIEHPSSLIELSPVIPMDELDAGSPSIRDGTHDGPGDDRELAIVSVATLDLRLSRGFSSLIVLVGTRRSFRRARLTRSSGFAIPAACATAATWKGAGLMPIPIPVHRAM